MFIQTESIDIYVKSQYSYIFKTSQSDIWSLDNFQDWYVQYLMNISACCSDKASQIKRCVTENCNEEMAVGAISSSAAI